MVQQVSDIGSNAEENIEHAAKIIGRSSHRRAVFETIYEGKKKIKSVKELMKKTDLSNIRVLDAGKKLADNNIVKQVKVNGGVCYEKIGFYRSHRNKILSFVDAPKKLERLSTKRRPQYSLKIGKIKLPSGQPKIKRITIDDITSFKKIKKIKRADQIGNTLSEKTFKKGLLKILNQKGKFVDWGGETSDIFTSQMIFKGKRHHAAFALKGPACKGVLTPGKMGKNGDQIQRLFQAPADIFIVQYCRQIEPSILFQMEQLAIGKSYFTGNVVYVGVIDGQDSKRLVLAYTSAFGKKKK